MAKCIKYGKNTYKPNILFDKIRNNPEFFAKKHGITGTDVEKVLGIGKSGSGIDYSFLSESDFDADGNVKPEVLAEIQAEREQIKADAVANGTWMKAPNGKKSKLNEQQYVDVRTKRFTDWFGDWQNDAENASKVIDDNGEPLVVYHGTPNGKISEFKEGKEPGYYFTNKEKIAQGYQYHRGLGLSKSNNANTESVFLNIRDVQEINAQNKIYNNIPVPYQQYQASRYGVKPRNAQSIPDAYKYYREQGKDGVIVRNVVDSPDGTYDTYYKGDVFIANNPNQIKSATSNAGTYSNKSGRIDFQIPTPQKPKNLMPKSLITSIADTIRNGGKSTEVMNVVNNSTWFKGLGKSTQENMTFASVKSTLVDSDKYHKENDKVKAKETSRTKTDEKIKAVKTKAKETAKEKVEEIKSAKEVIQQTINDASEKGLFKTVTSGKVLEYAMRKMNKAITPTQQKNLLNTVKKIINDNNYLINLNTAKAAQKGIAKSVKNKSFQKTKANITTARAFMKVNPTQVEDLDKYTEVATAIQHNLKGISVVNAKDAETKMYDAAVRNKNYLISNNEIEKYIDEQVKYQEKLKEDLARAEYDELARVGSLPVSNMTFEEYKDFLSVTDIDTKSEAMTTENGKKTIEERTKILQAIVGRKLRNDFEEYVKDNSDVFSEMEKSIIRKLRLINTSQLDYKQLVKLNDIINNVITNNSLMDAGAVSNIAQSQEDIRQLDEFKQTKGFNFLSLSDNWATRALQASISNDMLIEYMTNSTIASAKFKMLSGIQAVMDGHAKAKITQQNIVNSYIKTKQKYDWKVDSTENRIVRGVYAEMIRTKGGTDEDVQNEFTRKKGLIKQTYESLLASSKDNDNREGEFVKQAYDAILADAENVSDIEANLAETKFGDFNKKAVQHWIKQHATYQEKFIEHGSIYNNKELSAENNYSGRRYRPITKQAQVKEGYDLFESIYRSSNVSDKMSGSKNETINNIQLPSGMVLDLNFDSVQTKVLYENLYDLETSEGIARLKLFLTNPENIERIGGVRNMEVLQNVMKNTVLSQKNAMPFENNDLAKAIDKIAGSVMMKSARMALGSVMQLPKQYVSVLVNTTLNLGTDIPLLFQAYSAGNNIQLFDQFNIGLRGTTIAGYNKENLAKSDENAGAVDKLNSALYNANKASKYLYDGTMKALEFSDVQVARTSWLAFYMQYVKKNTDRDVNSINWENEHLNPNVDAAAYAEQKVSRLQNANDPSSMADAFKDTNTAMRVLKNMVLPYSTFAVNQRARMIGDVQKIIHGSIDGRADAMKSLGATIVEQAVFNGMKIYFIGNLAGYLGKAALMGLMGWDDEDAEELFASAEKYTNQKFITNTLSDVFFSGMGAATQTGLQNLTNQVTKLINGKEYFYNFKNDSAKTGIPDWVTMLGAYGTSVSTAFGVLKDGKYLSGYGDEIVSGGTEDKIVKQEVELSSDTKKIIWATFIIDALALAGFSDQFVLQINQKIKKGRDKMISDELGTEFNFKIYSPSTKDDFYRLAKSEVEGKSTPEQTDAKAEKLGLIEKAGGKKKYNEKIKDAAFAYRKKKHQDYFDELKTKYESKSITKEKMYDEILSKMEIRKQADKVYNEIVK